MSLHVAGRVFAPGNSEAIWVMADVWHESTIGHAGSANAAEQMRKALVEHLLNEFLNEYLKMNPVKR